MRTTHLAVVLLALLFCLFLFQGCGETEDPSQGEAPAAFESQAKEEQKKSPSVEEITEIPSPVTPAEREVTVEDSGSNDVIVIENLGYENDKKKPVRLNHKKHSEEYGIACDNCHHLYQEGTNIWKQGDPVQKCVACHDPVEDQEKAMKLQSAFHKNCRDCHKEMTQEGREAPYKKCTDCHG